jgi:membrane protein
LLRTRDSGRKVVLASSASQEELDHYLELLDARSIVAATTSKDDVEHSKPCPDIFRTAAQKAQRRRTRRWWSATRRSISRRQAGPALPALRSAPGKFSDEQLRGSLAIYDDVAALLSGFDRSPLAA